MQLQNVLVWVALLLEAVQVVLEFAVHSVVDVAEKLPKITLTSGVPQVTPLHAHSPFAVAIVTFVSCVLDLTHLTSNNQIRQLLRQRLLIRGRNVKMLNSQLTQMVQLLRFFAVRTLGIT